MGSLKPSRGKLQSPFARPSGKKGREVIKGGFEASGEASIRRDVA
jgi:hypothetical protein